jgi:hypothetical protein
MKAKLIAPCGMNCAICMAFLREKNGCEGCWSPEWRHKKCSIRSCENLKGKYCFRCSSFPCKRLVQLDARYRKNYGMSMLENLEAIRNTGIRKFIRNEKIRWTCPHCGETICVHRRRCSACGVRVVSRGHEEEENSSEFFE